MEQNKKTFDIYLEIGNNRTNALVAFIEKSITPETADKILDVLRNEK